jgi:4'-phosphopantetheinyl transferase
VSIFHPAPGYDWLAGDAAVSVARSVHADLLLVCGTPRPEALLWAEQIISTDELQRADRFVFPHHRARFIFRRGLLRRLLGGLLDCEPSVIELQTNSWGKPVLAGPMTGRLRFNLSHSDDAVLFATAAETEIGVDIERVRPLGSIASMAAMIMHPDELDRWQTLPEHAQHASFYRLWALKEAVLKCIGCGLAIEPSTFKVDPDTENGVSYRIEVDDPQAVPRLLMLSAIEGPTEFSLAVASERKPA